MYEVIRAGRPCHLYFDLEFSKPANPGLDADSRVDLLLGLVRQELRCVGGGSGDSGCGCGLGWVGLFELVELVGLGEGFRGKGIGVSTFGVLPNYMLWIVQNSVAQRMSLGWCPVSGLVAAGFSFALSVLWV